MLWRGVLPYMYRTRPVLTCIRMQARYRVIVYRFNNSLRYKRTIDRKRSRYYRLKKAVVSIPILNFKRLIRRVFF